MSHALMTTGRAALLVAAVAVAAGAAVTVTGTGAAAPPQLRVAVVDMARILRGSEEWRDSVEERSRLLDTMKRTLSKLSQQAQVLRNEYQNLAPGTQERDDKGADLERALREMEQTRLDFEDRIARQHSQSVLSLFRSLDAVVADYAREHGVSLVLKKQQLEPGGPQGVEESLQLATAEVLYADSALDISEPIIAALNAQYEAPIEVK